MKKNKVLAIIPARAGSKGIPGKNKMNFLGKPLIEYTIEAALESEILNDIVISTNDEDILKIASSFNIFALKRPEIIAGDNAPVSEAIQHAIKYMEEKNNLCYEYIMLLQPTSPLRKGRQIDEVIEILEKESNANSVISVVEMHDTHPARMYYLDKYLKPIIPELEEMHRQNIPVAYYRNGAIYLFKKEPFLSSGKVMLKPIIPYIMDEKYLLNIDSDRDVIIAEALIKSFINDEK